MIVRENPRKVLVTGNRKGLDPECIEKVLRKFPLGTILIHGAAKGVDTQAANIAQVLGFDVRAFPADWDTYHRGAGPIRNKQMLDENPDEVIAFHHDISTSKGTRNMVQIALKKGTPVSIYNGIDPEPKTGL